MDNCDTDWKARLQRYDDKPNIHQRHAAREFGPVPEGGARVISFAKHAALKQGGADVA
ncbi:hypothetical protein [Novosphingobium olei]|uniref:Uncharacterized protein n=1 Tax=Novosphingobium olei TaxID=2728851 RepID=A0A7Y0GBK6_9SPHN|nr:hypothetical protein [Novosphingobium olei]NML94732.1 hypothetical protein [Novosphingobium olei]